MAEARDDAPDASNLRVSDRVVYPGYGAGTVQAVGPMLYIAWDTGRVLTHDRAIIPHLRWAEPDE